MRAQWWGPFLISGIIIVASVSVSTKQSGEKEWRESREEEEQLLLLHTVTKLSIRTPIL